MRKPISILIKPAEAVTSQGAGDPPRPLPTLSLKSQPTGTFVFGQTPARSGPDPFQASPTVEGWGSGIPAGSVPPQAAAAAAAEWVTFEGDQAPKRLPPRPSEVGEQSWEIQPAPAAG